MQDLDLLYDLSWRYMHDPNPHIVGIYRIKKHDLIHDLRYWPIFFAHTVSYCSYFWNRIFCKEGEDTWTIKICVAGIVQPYFFYDLFRISTKWRCTRPRSSTIHLWHTIVVHGTKVYGSSGGGRIPRQAYEFGERIPLILLNLVSADNRYWVW